MDIASSNIEALASIQNAIQMTVLRNAMNLNSGTVSLLVEGMQDISRTVLENSVTPYKGSNIDISG